MHLRPLQVDEPARVLRSRDAFGALNLNPVAFTDEEIRDAVVRRIRLIDALSDTTCTVSDADRQRARDKVCQAAATLSTSQKRTQACEETVAHPIRPETRVRCPVDIDALDEHIAHPESNKVKKDSRLGVTYRALATRLRDRAAPAITQPEEGTEPHNLLQIVYAGIIPVDGRGFWLQRVQHQGKQVWADFGADHSHNDADPWQTARNPATSLVDISLGTSSIELTGIDESSSTMHFICDISGPPRPHPHADTKMKRFNPNAPRIPAPPLRTWNQTLDNETNTWRRQGSWVAHGDRNGAEGTRA